MRMWINNIVVQRSACSACFGNLAEAIRELANEGGFAINGGTVSFEKKSILIGQDFKDVVIPQGITGIGTCTCGKTSDKTVSLKGCPPSRESIKDFLSRR